MRTFIIETEDLGYIRISNSEETFNNLRIQGLDVKELIRLGTTDFFYMQETFTISWADDALLIPHKGMFMCGEV